MDAETKTETKAEAWVRVINQRLEKAIPRLRMIHTLGNRTNYDYTPKQAIEVVEILRKEVTAIEKALLQEQPDSNIPKVSLPIEEVPDDIEDNDIIKDDIYD